MEAKKAFFFCWHYGKKFKLAPCSFLYPSNNFSLIFAEKEENKLARCVVCKREISRGRLCEECSKKINLRTQEILRKEHHRLLVVKRGWGDYVM